MHKKILVEYTDVTPEFLNPNEDNLVVENCPEVAVVKRLCKPKTHVLSISGTLKIWGPKDDAPTIVTMSEEAAKWSDEVIGRMEQPNRYGNKDIKEMFPFTLELDIPEYLLT